MTTTLSILFALLLLPIVVLLWLTESPERRIVRLHSYGWSQRRIAAHMGISRYRVRLALV
jgi:DNA-directed RNA polymerase specialized sigma24 family protein